MLGHRTVLPHSAKTPGWGEKPALGVWDAGASRTAGAQEWEERAPGALLSPRPGATYSESRSCSPPPSV